MKPEITTPETWAMWGWIVEAVAARYGVTIPAVLGRKRCTLIAQARNDLMVSLWGSGLPFAEVGRLVGRDHTTVMAAVRKVLP